MALKDWKKTRESTKNELYYKEWLNIKTQKIIRLQMIKGMKYGIIEAYSGITYQHLLESFKSETKALKYAKQYMKTH